VIAGIAGIAVNTISMDWDRGLGNLVIGEISKDRVIW
jgi:hypothetical protein